MNAPDYQLASMERELGGCPHQCEVDGLPRVIDECEVANSRLCRVNLHFEEITYPFWIGNHCVDEIAAHIAGFLASSLHIVTDEVVNQLHVAPLAQCLRNIAPVYIWRIAGGEMRKTYTYDSDRS